MKLLGITIAYNPDVRDLRENILLYVNHLDCLIIWNNSKGIDLEKELNFEPATGSKIFYMGDGTNYGIAFPANKAVEYAAKNGYSHILFMDQDSKWKEFKEYKDNIELGNDLWTVYYPTYIMDDSKLEAAHWTSGCIAPLEVFKRVGLFREDYAIDTVDTEFSLRCEVNGINQINLPNQMVHFLGTVEYHGTYCTRNYSPFRLYHITKNELKIWKEYRDANVMEPLKLSEYIKKIFFITKNMLYFESDKIPKLLAICRGMIEGLFYSPKKAEIKRIS